MKVSGGEDGEIPESDAIVEMKHQSKTTTTTTTTITSDSSNKKDNNSYWMRDLYKYSSYRGYGAASGLYNLAWAQAVQNKPLNEVLVELDDKKNNKNASTDDTSVNKEQGEVQQHCVESKEVFEVVDSEKEEGELEEGEIDFDSDDTGNNHNSNGNKVQDDFGGLEMDDGELENQVSSIRKVLHNVTVAEAHK